MGRKQRKTGRQTAEGTMFGDAKSGAGLPLIPIRIGGASPADDQPIIRAGIAQAQARTQRRHNNARDDQP